MISQKPKNICRHTALALLLAPLLLSSPLAEANAGKRITPPPKPSVPTLIEAGEPQVELKRNKHHVGMTKKQAQARAKANRQ